MKNKKKAAAPIRVLLADDHAVLRKGLRLLLEEEGDITVVAEAGDGREAVELAREHSPDVVVMDITMPNLGGIEATRQIIADFPDTRVIALSIHKGKQFVEDMLRAGAAGYLLKESAPKELLDAVRAVMGGETILSSSITGVVVAQYMSALKGDGEEEGGEPLTPREREEARRAVEGLPLPEIAAIFGVSPEEAEESQHRILKKLEVANVAELSELADNKKVFEEEDGPDFTAVAQPVAVLQTKLFAPAVPKEHIHRTALLDCLAAQAHKPLTLVSAPAGYGKSTLVSCWLGESGRPVAWLSLDKDENDLRSFLHYFVAAIGTVVPDALPDLRAILSGPAIPSPDVVAGILANELENLEESLTLVLDDFHLIEKRPVLDLVAALLHHPPRTLHLVLISRRDPLLPLTSLRAGELMHEIRTQDLCFTPEETAVYLQEKLGSPVEPSIAAAWAEKTEGWITGLQLASLSIGRGGEAGSLLPELHGGAHYVMEYLFNEVLLGQPPPVRRCLMVTSILDRFCAPLCEAVCGPEQKGSTGWEFLRSIKAEGLFVINLDAEGRWFRYHHLFHQLLKNQAERHFSPDERAAFHSRAGAWFAEQGFIEEAMDHSLAAGDEGGAAELFERNRQEVLNNDVWYLFEKWLPKFRGETVRQRPGLLMARVWTFYHHFEIAAIPDVLDAAELLLKGDPVEVALWGEIDFFRGYILYFMNEGALSLERLEAALKKIPSSSGEVRGQAEILYGLATQMEGGKDEAVARLNDLLSRRLGLHGVWKTRLLVTLVFIHVISGEMEKALAANRQLYEFSAKGGYEYARAWSVYLQGLVHFFRNNLEAAKKHFTLAVEKKYILHTRAVLDSMAGLILISQAMGQHDEVRDLLESLHEYTGSLNDPVSMVLAQSCQARLAILQGKREGVSEWLRKTPPPLENMVWWLEIPSLTHCRVLVAEGSDKSLESAEVRLRELLRLNSENHNVLHMVEILSLLAVACQSREKTEEGLNFLDRALDLGAPGSLIRPFVEAGPPMADLLKKAVREGKHGEFARTLLSAISGGERDAAKGLRVSSNPQPLVDPLTRREIELLEQLAQRFSNNEIAEHLFISPTTVKAHLRNIFQKLDVGNRREAVARAHELGILQ